MKKYFIAATLILVFTGFAVAEELSILERGGFKMPDLKGHGDMYSDCGGGCFYISKNGDLFEMEVFGDGDEDYLWKQTAKDVEWLIKENGKMYFVFNEIPATGLIPVAPVSPEVRSQVQPQPQPEALTPTLNQPKNQPSQVGIDVKSASKKAVEDSIPPTLKRAMGGIWR